MTFLASLNYEKLELKNNKSMSKNSRSKTIKKSLSSSRMKEGSITPPPFPPKIEEFNQLDPSDKNKKVLSLNDLLQFVKSRNENFVSVQVCD